VAVEAVPFARHGSRHTRDFEDLVAWFVAHVDKTAVTRLCRINWRTTGAIVERVVADQLVGLAEDVDRGEHPGTEDNLDMELRALDHIVETSEAFGIDTTVPEMPRVLVKSAIARGFGRDGFSRIVDILRSPGAGP
jgi:hypothetical protein